MQNQWSVLWPDSQAARYSGWQYNYVEVAWSRGTQQRWTATCPPPKSDQVQISPVASPVILHHTVWRTWLFIAYSDWKMILVPVLTTSLIHFSWKGWENVLFELGSERVKKVVNWYKWIIFHLSKLWKAMFFVLCADYCQWGWRGNLKLITLGSERVNHYYDLLHRNGEWCKSYCCMCAANFQVGHFTWLKLPLQKLLDLQEKHWSIKSRPKWRTMKSSSRWSFSLQRPSMEQQTWQRSLHEL